MTEDPEITVGLLAARFDDEYPDSAPEWVADRAARSVRAGDRLRLLVALLTDRIEGRRRVRARQVERDATEAVVQVAQRERWEAAEQERQDYYAANPSQAPRNTRLYRDWVRTTPEGQRYEQGRLAEAQARAERDRLRVEDPEAYEERYNPWRQMARMLDQFRADVRLELTLELLGSSFSLGDGHVTTWGAATVEQHEQRIALLMRGIEGTAQTAALHAKAIELLNEQAAACLNDVRFAA